MSFSYAHLPLASLHHSLGSLFNYVGFVLVCVAVTKLAQLRFERTEVIALSGCLVILIAAVLGQALKSLMFRSGSAEADLVVHSALTFPSAVLPLVAVLLIVRLASMTSFTFRDLAHATRFATIILCGYLAIELLGARFEIEPFATIVRLVSRYLNYRDDLDMLGGRLRGFSNEPSYLAVVVVFMCAVVLVDNTVSDLKRYSLLMVVLALSSASLSKNIFVGLMVLLIVHALYFRRLIPMMAIVLATLVALFYANLGQSEAILQQYEDFGIDISTLTRVGSWVAAWNGFLENPLFGNGLGLTGKLLVAHYPEWFYSSPEASQWEVASAAFGTPVFSNLFRTLFELGLFGVVFVAFQLFSFTRISNSRSLLAHDNAILLTAFLVSYGMVDVLTFWPWYAALAIRRPAGEVR